MPCPLGFDNAQIRRRLRNSLLLIATLCLLGTVPSRLQSGELGFLEKFALAPDRSLPLNELIPGTEDYYYYHCLHFQQTEQFDRVEELLTAWIDKHNVSNRVVEIRHRQALLTYATNPGESLAYLINTLNLQFNHQRETVDQAAELPVALDATLIDRQRLLNQALQNHRNLNGLENSALPMLVSKELTNEQRRELLQRLSRPDLEGLIDVVAADLQGRDRAPFGAYPLHQLLLRSQLDTLIQRLPNLLNETNFVSTYLRKLAPPAGVDLQYNLDARRAYLDTLWQFVSRLSEVHNSLKAHVLYHRLQLDIQTNQYDKQRLLAYLKLPRSVSYINPRYLQLPQNRNYVANLNESFDLATELAAIGSDDAVVRQYLQHFLVQANDYQEYQPYVEDNYLKQLFAETKIVNGLGDAQRWTTLLTPAQYQALRDRVDLDFAPTNPQVIQSDEPIELDVFTKNVPTLIIKVYRINALNYYQDQSSHIGTDINLDGLVANLEQTHTYDASPFLRVRRRFRFDELKDPGVYVIDLIGSGKSSRVLIHKGKLSYLQQMTSAGHLFTVLDDQDRALKDARIWMAGKFYAPDESGDILIPLSTNGGTQPIVLVHGTLASFAQFEHQTERYELQAGFFVPRESLRSRHVAPLLIRTNLLLNGMPISRSLLEDVSLKITANDQDDSPTTIVVNDIQLTDDSEFIYEFRVPPRLKHLGFQLQAKVKQLTTGERTDLFASGHLEVNLINSTHETQVAYLAHDASGYQIEILGKSGEPIARRPVYLALKHRDFRDPVETTLRTDDAGRVQLGPLPGIASVQVVGSGEIPTRSWSLDESQYRNASEIHVKSEVAFEVPYAGASESVDDTSFSLLAIRGGVYAESLRDRMTLKENALHISGLPRGDYVLLMHSQNQSISIRVGEGTATHGHVVDGNRALELSDPQPVRITKLVNDGAKVTVQIANITPSTRVHIVANRFQPHQDAYRQLDRLTLTSLSRFGRTALPSFYVQGRKLGDEYRYVLDRKYAIKFAGNMLERPELLLNPWALRDTVTEREELAAGDDFARAQAAPDALMDQAYSGAAQQDTQGDFADLDFLAGDTFVAANLRPDGAGQISIDLDKLLGERMVYVVLVDLDRIEQRIVKLPATERPQVDLRLAKGLDPRQHFALEKQITVAAANELLTIDSLGSGRYQLFDSLQQVYEFYRTLLPNGELDEFRFIVDWPGLTDKEKRDHYSRFACHELNFFLAQQDPEFFAAVVQPYLANKLYKTFLDHYLLGDDLTIFTSPWYYDQLNDFEKILLSKRLSSEAGATKKLLEDRWAVSPMDQERLNRLFDAALLGDSLAADAGMPAPAMDMSLDADGVDPASQVQLGINLPRGGAGGVPARTYGFNSRRGRWNMNPRAAGQPRPETAVAEEFSAKNGVLMESRAGRRAFGVDRLARGAELRDKAAEKLLYQAVDQTKEWAENNYYHLPIEQQTADRVVVNAFWLDWANHQGDAPFRSTHFTQASSNFTEAMLALAVLDLPFEKPEHEYKVVDQAMRIRLAGPAIVFREGIQSSEVQADAAPVLVSQNFFRHGERTQFVEGREVDRFVTDEFLVGVVYGCQLVVTNPTSSQRKLDILTQIPTGAMPVDSGKAIKSRRVELQPYSTTTVEYYFYFPTVGDFAHFPVHVTQDAEVVAAADPFVFHVVKELSQVDQTSWAYVSQHASSEEVIEYLESQNLQTIDLGRIAHRMSDASFFDTAIQTLRKHHAYDHTLWSYALKHDRPVAIQEYLRHEPMVIDQSGLILRSPLLNIDPVARNAYQHLEYHPLVNARTHQVGAQRTILNDRLFEQYQQWLTLLAYEPSPSDQQRLQTVYYLLVQDRVAEAIELFRQLDRDQIHTDLQYDYCQAYLNMSQGDAANALAIADRYANHPVDRWRDAFALVRKHVAEINGSPSDSFDDADRDQRMDRMAAQSSSFDFELADQQIKLNYRNLNAVRIHYYQMDIELLFSRNPFVQQRGGQFAYIAPNLSETVELEKSEGTVAHRVPESLRNQNVLIEVEAEGQRRSQPFFSNSLNVQMNENFGQLRVVQQESGEVLPKVYCKVYARLNDGSVVFYKDGYTDLRGRFDYATLSTNLLDQVDRFSLLVLSDEYGARVQEAVPPKR